jgi:hypothetical protein
MRQKASMSSLWFHTGTIQPHISDTTTARLLGCKIIDLLLVTRRFRIRCAGREPGFIRRRTYPIDISLELLVENPNSLFEKTFNESVGEIPYATRITGASFRSPNVRHNHILRTPSCADERSSVNVNQSCRSMCRSRLAGRRVYTAGVADGFPKFCGF